MLVRINNENADYQKFGVLKTNRNKRYRYGEFLVEGVRNINQAMHNGWEITGVLYSESASLSSWAQEVLKKLAKVTNYVLTQPLLEKLSSKEDTSELMITVQMRDDDWTKLQLSEKPFLVLFDRPSNRGNLGTMLRSADALGVEALIITGHCVDLYDPEVIAASMGSFFNIPVIRLQKNSEVEELLKTMKERYEGFQAFATTAHKKTAIFEEDMSGACVLMVGNETDGLSHCFYEMADTMISIPMAETSSASSFNVACAATVMMYEAVRQRKVKG